MSEPWLESSMRRICASTGASLLACLTLASVVLAAAPAPDPPPLPVAPEPAPTPRPAPTPVPRATVPSAPPTTFVPSTIRVAPAVTVPRVARKAAPAKKATPKRVQPASRPKSVVRTTSPPRDRFVLALPVSATTDEPFERALLLLAGAGLALVAAGGSVVLLAVRKQLGGLAA